MQSDDQSGFLLVDKPEDWTSHDVVAYLRGVTKIKKIGHAGTLDPFATGLLIVAIGRQATKRIDEFKNMPKEYVATMTLGATSNTQDRTGTITEQNSKMQIEKIQVEKALASFVGVQMQVPPMFSAKKVKGKKMYELARKGIEVEREPVEIEISEIELMGIEENQVTMRVACGTGTYIRTLCHDIGKKLGTGAYCEELRRTKIGAYSVEDAVRPKELTAELIEKRLLSI